jgi:hypothetical protein
MSAPNDSKLAWIFIGIFAALIAITCWLLPT